MKLFNRTKPMQISKDEERLIFAMQLLGDKTRYKISQHFRNFELIGLVDKERMGQKMCYMLKADDYLVKELAAMIKKGYK
jgi:hypothetical protein